MSNVRRPTPGMSTKELMSFTLAELLMAQQADREAMRAYTIDFPGAGRLVVAMAVGEDGQLLLEAVADRVNAIRERHGLPPREVPTRPDDGVL